MSSSTVWPTVIAALGSSFLAVLGSFGVVQWQRWRDGKAKTKAEKFAAYAELHSRAFSIAYRIQAFGLLKRARSGLGEGFDIAMRQRKPVDILELHDWLEVESRPLHDAYSRVCVVGSQEAIDIATKIMGASGKLMDAAIATDEHRSRARRYIGGEVQTAEQAQLLKEAVEALFKLRELLAAVIRQESGSDPVIFPIHQTGLERAGEKAVEK